MSAASSPEAPLRRADQAADIDALEEPGKEKLSEEERTARATLAVPCRVASF
jgi:hypothetical protein